MKLKYLFHIALAGLIVCTLWSCDTIKEEDRLIYVDPLVPADPEDSTDSKVVNLRVLIEDFTGQRCVNCPTATEAIENLQEQYGADKVIAVGIHSGPFGHRTTMTSPRLSLCTETGDAYYTQWGIESQPGVKINRSAPIYNYAQYGAIVRGELQKMTPLDITLNLQYDADAKSVDIDVNAMSGKSVNGKLQVWVIENEIIDAQMMPDGSQNTGYVHQHVFRTSVTSDIFGDNFSIEEGTTKSVSYSVTLDEKWNPENIAIVAFVSNTADGVLQVVKANIIDITKE